MSLQLTMLPAGEGDALYLEWGPDDDRRRIIVDMGVHATGRKWRERIEAMPEDKREFDLLVVTHVDTDHIYGVLSALVNADPIPGFRFADVWFNGWAHLNAERVAPYSPPAQDVDEQTASAHLRDEANRAMHGADFESYGGRQGEQFSLWLRQQPWNVEFDGAAVARLENAPGPVIPMAHGLTLTVLGPTPAQLEALRPDWRNAVKKALKSGALTPDDVAPDLVPDNFEAYGRRKPREPRLRSMGKLIALAETEFESDDSAANGSSIALMVSYQGHNILLAGDAHPAALISALQTQYPDGPPALTAFKLPHHGSQKNVSPALLDAVRCANWLISTNGVKHYHPDAAAMARVLHFGQPLENARPTLFFNEPSEFNGWWGQSSWQQRFGYDAHFGSPDDGLTIEFADGDVTVVQA